MTFSNYFFFPKEVTLSDFSYKEHSLEVYRMQSLFTELVASQPLEGRGDTMVLYNSINSD